MLTAAMCGALAAVVQGAPPHAAKVTCASCHPAEAQSQPKTDMGIGIEIPPNQKLLQEHPRLTLDANGYHYQVEYKSGAATYAVSDGSGALTLPIQYAFGVHNQSFVLEYRHRFYESLVSYYHLLGGLAITIGDEGLRPHSLVEAMGRQIADQEIAACFNCHGTGGVAADGKLTLDALTPGLSCVHCHTGAEAHMHAMAAGKRAAVPRKLGEMAAEEMSRFCGECHRTWESVVSLGLFGEKNVRFQPYRLANSRCFLGDDKRIRCTACHDPHADLVREDASYDRVCLSCHGPTPAGNAATNRVMQKACPVAKSECVSCHMPKVGTEAVFTDHEIRVAHPGDPYPH